MKETNSEGITFDAYSVAFIKHPSRAAVFEEMIHITQYRQDRNDGTPLSRIKCEIEAKEKLLKHQKFYKLTKIEIEDTKNFLEQHRLELEALIRKEGYYYD